MVNSREGYYSSARTGGAGDLDIYLVDFDATLKPDTASDPLLAIKPPEKEAEKKVNEAPATSATGKFLSGTELEKTGWTNGALYFNYNEYTLRNDARMILDHNIDVMKANKNLTISIQGFSDARGPEKYNIRLSANRAQAVKQYILGKGIAVSRIKSTEGLGESGLLNDCGEGCDDAQHQVNRRVEIRVLNENYKPQGVVTTGLR
jgi:outer membrane protein OmpA-like peptidoglycan-associated protein